MLKNYLKIAFRNFFKQKLYSIINITAIEWWIFLLAGGIALLIAILTIGHQAFKAALSNPVEALRYE